MLPTMACVRKRHKMDVHLNAAPERKGTVRFCFWVMTLSLKFLKDPAGLCMQQNQAHGMSSIA